MAESRLRIQKDLEKSLAGGAVLVTDAAAEAAYLPRGAAGQVLTIVGTSPSWQTPITGSAFTISDGTNIEVINSGETMFAAAGAGLNVLVRPTDTFEFSAQLSTDADNALIFGTDNGLFVPIANILVSAVWDDINNELVLTFTDSSVVAIPIDDVVGQFLADFQISDGIGAPDTINNHEVLTFLGTHKITTTVANNSVTVSLDTTGSTSGQVLTSTGGGAPPAWQAPASSIGTPLREEFSPTAGLTTVALANTPNSLVTLDVYRNGLLLQTSQYSVAANIITFIVPFGASAGAVFSETVTAKYFI